MKMPNDLIRQTEAAEHIGVSKQYISKLIRGHKLKSYTVAKLVSRSDVEKLKAKSQPE